MVFCHLITALGFGGAEKLLVELVNIQSEENEVHIIYLKGEPVLSKALSSKVQVHKIEFGVTSAAEIRRFIKKLQPQIVHTHLGHADLIGLWAIRGLPLKRFCTMHNIWFKFNWVDRIIFFAYRLLFKTVAKHCKVIAISKAVQQHIEERLRVKKSNVFLLYNAIPDRIPIHNRLQQRDRLNLSKKDFCILFVGRLEKQKSIQTLLLAVNHLKNKIDNLRVLIVGDGSLKNKLIQLSNELEITKLVSFVGTTSSPEIYFDAADVFVLPSIFEGFGIVILEAFRSSLPVIASRIEGPSELITHEDNGLLFASEDHDDLAGQILKLNDSPHLRSVMALKGFQSYLNNFNIINYAEKVKQMYLM